MTDELLTAQVALAREKPEIAWQVKKLALDSGVDEQEWEDKAHELEMSAQAG